MPTKRLCYLTSQRVTAFQWTKGTLKKEASFGMDRAGVGEFSKYVTGAKGSLFYLLADLVEEDFYLENIPSVRGSDRRTLLKRKLGQRYRDTSLALPISLGFETHAGRREERILYTSFTNAGYLQPWLGILRSSEARVAGVFSVPLLAPIVGRRLGFKRGRCILVSLQEGGLRQSYVENGQIRFSRLGRVDLSDPRVLAQDCAAESNRIHQYLVNTRILPREATPMDVLVLAPSEHKAFYDAACVSTARLRFRVFDLDRVATSMGLRSAPVETLAEGLFLHILAQSAPGEQYADDMLRRFYDLWRARVGLLAIGSAAFAACLVLSAINLFDASVVSEQSRGNRLDEARAAQEYAKLQTRFPKTPTSSDDLAAIVKNYRTVLRQTAGPASLFEDVSEAVTPLSQVQIDKINWEVGAPEKKAASESTNSVLPAFLRTDQKSAAQVPQQLVETAEISGRLIVQQASDYRAVTALVNRFTEALRQKRTIEVVQARLPFDINAEKNLSGDIGAAKSQEVPQFSVQITRRAPK